MSPLVIHRILTIDDNPSIHEDFRKLFVAGDERAAAFDEFESRIFGSNAKPTIEPAFELDCACQGQEGLEKIKAALAAGRPYALAFVDVRMPPGWDGVETIERLWQADPELQVVICTAYSDYSWADMRQRLGNSDSLLVLKKPFDAVEVLQLAYALTRKWELARQARASMEELDRKVTERTQALECEMAERARVEDSLRQAQKMEAVGQLAAGIAHDFNNLLTVIQGNAELMLATPAGGLDMTECLKQIGSASQRAATLTGQLLVFSRKSGACRKPVDLNLVLTNANKLLRRLIGEHIELGLALCERPTCLMADESNLVQVIMNLAINARDAMPDGGLLTLRTSIETLNAESTQRHPQARLGSFVCLTMTDSGCGMDDGTLRRIFEPFFTTKDIGKGTGLGLSTVYGIVQRHEGWIEVSSHPGQGTTFKVFLPHRDAPLPVIAKSDLAFSLPPPGPVQFTILVVEDDPAVRLFAKTVLTMNSYRVVEATDGVNALQVWSEHGGRVDLLFTDMVMPNGLSGRGLAEKLENECPSLKVIYSSGFNAESTDATGIEEPGFNFLRKPYTAEDLLRAVSSGLSSPKHLLVA